jgi:hypothetical protein
VDEGYEANLEDVKTKDRVLPYVEDRRNIAILRWADSLDDETAVTLQYAIERGIETSFQLEDSELSSELLPDGDDRGRVLFVEAAEGGAGVLRRLQGEADALPRAATEALRIMHVDPVTGADAADSCVRGCYRCLLTYGNQSDHELIDRRLAIPLFRRLAAGSTAPANPEAKEDSDAMKVPSPVPPHTSPATRSLLQLLKDKGLLTPDGIGVEVDGITVDLVFNQRRAAVVFDPPNQAPLDTVPLLMSGWNVLHIPPDIDLEEVVGQNPSVFGGVNA